MLKIIIWLGLKYPDQFIRLLSKLEYNNYIYLTKLADKARKERHFNLSKILLKQAKEEEYHGKTLSCLVDGENKLKVDKSGYWQSISNVQGDILVNYIDKTDPTIKVAWKDKMGQYVQLDGVSKRYFSARYFFSNKSAFDYSWEDQLAFMSILEKQTTKLYLLLSSQPFSPLQRIAAKLAKEEHNHQSSLYYTLSSFTATPNYYISKWEDRLFIAKLGLLVDITYFLYKQILNRWQTRRSLS